MHQWCPTATKIIVVLPFELGDTLFPKRVWWNRWLFKQTFKSLGHK